MASDGVKAWAARVPLWDSDGIASQARAWLKGQGKGLLELRSSQIGSLRDSITQTRSNKDLQTAIETLGGSAAEHHKSPWNRKGAQPALRTLLWNATEAAIASATTHASDERTAFEALNKFVSDEAASRAIGEERDLKIRKQFLLFAIDGCQAREWLKEDAE